ncbi:hypothetical protein ES703_08239 [subsurface metagenome]
MPKYEVTWEERRYTIVEADSPEEAKELVRNGEFDKTFSEEITLQPEVTDIIPE